MVVSGILLLHWLFRLTFWRDEWEFLLHRRAWSPSSFLDPWVEELLTIPVAIYKVLVTTFGMSSAKPFQVVAVLLFLASVLVVFVYVRRRIGPWLGLAFVLPVLFLGQAWDDLLFPFQMALFGSIACGVGALLAIDRDDRRGNLAAMFLLIGSLFFFNLGIAFVAGVTLELALRSDRFRRSFVVVVPTAIWLIWYAGWGHKAHTFISFHNFAHLPSYVLDGLATTAATWPGLAASLGGFQSSPLDWGRPLLLVAIALVALRLYRIGRPPARVFSTLAILLGFWSLTALNTNPFAAATVGRYQYISVILAAIVAAELLRGLEIRPGATAAVLAVALASALSNGTQLHDFAATLAGFSQQERGSLAALELARDRVDPNLELTTENSGVDWLGLLDAGSYLSAADAYGSPAYPPDHLAQAPENTRVSADKVSAAALRVGLAPAPRGSVRCLAPNLASGPAETQVPAGGLVLHAQTAGVVARLRRYADSYPVVLGELPAAQAERLRIARDRSARPWILQLSGPGTVAVCGSGRFGPS